MTPDYGRLLHAALCAAIRVLTPDNSRSPAVRATDEAIELAIARQSPYPDNPTFVDAAEAWTGEAIKRAADEGRAAVCLRRRHQSRGGGGWRRSSHVAWPHAERSVEGVTLRFDHA